MGILIFIASVVSILFHPAISFLAAAVVAFKIIVETLSCAVSLAFTRLGFA